MIETIRRWLGLRPAWEKKLIALAAPYKAEFDRMSPAEKEQALLKFLDDSAEEQTRILNELVDVALQEGPCDWDTKMAAIERLLMFMRANHSAFEEVRQMVWKRFYERGIVSTPELAPLGAPE